MQKSYKTGLLDLFRVKAVVFTGILAGALTMAACSGMPGRPGADGATGATGGTGAAGGDGGSGVGPGSISYSPDKPCYNFTHKGFSEKTEVSLNRRTVVTDKIDGQGVQVPNSVLPTQFTGPDGCLEAGTLPVYDDGLTRYTVSLNSASKRAIKYYARPKAAASTQVSGEVVIVYPSMAWNETTHFIDILRTGTGYSFLGTDGQVIEDFYTANGTNCSALDDLFENGTIDVAGENGNGFEAVMNCAANNGALMLAMADEFNSFYYPREGFVDNEFDDSGTAIDNNTTLLGSATYTGNDNNFTIMGSSSAANCSLGTWLDANVTVSYNIGNLDINQTSTRTSCLLTNFDNVYQGVHGAYNSVDTSLNAEYGFVLLSNGIPSVRKNDHTTFSYITAGIAYFAGKGTAQSADVNLKANNYQDYNLSSILHSGAGDSTLVMYSNQDNDVHVDAVGGTTQKSNVDDDTQWMIFSEVPTANVFGSAATTMEELYDDIYYGAPGTDKNYDIVLVQECNPSPDVKFDLTNYAAAGTGDLRVRQTLTHAADVSVNGEGQYRTFAGSMLILSIDPDDATTFGNIADVALQQLIGFPAAQQLWETRQILTSAGVPNISPWRLAEIIARTGALCIPELTEFGNGSFTSPGDDINIVDIDSDNVITSHRSSLGSKPDLTLVGRAPGSAISHVGGNTYGGDDQLMTGMRGVVGMTFQPSEAGAVVELPVITAGGQEQTVEISK